MARRRRPKTGFREKQKPKLAPVTLPNADKDPILDVVGALVPITPENVPVSLVKCQSPGCKGRHEIPVNGMPATKFDQYQRVGVTCSNCGQRFQVGRRLVNL